VGSFTLGDFCPAVEQEVRRSMEADGEHLVDERDYLNVMLRNAIIMDSDGYAPEFVVSPTWNQYKRTRRWAVIREWAVERAEHRCQLCNSASKKLDVHHRTYDRYGMEKAADLVVLCGRCHSKFHGKR